MVGTRNRGSRIPPAWDCHAPDDSEVWLAIHVPRTGLQSARRATPRYGGPNHPTGTNSPRYSARSQAIDEEDCRLGKERPRLAQAQVAGLTTKRNDNVPGALAVDQRHDAGGDGFHHRLVLGLIAMPIVHVGNAALGMVLNSVHGVAAEAERRNRAAVCPPQVVRSQRRLDRKLGA